MTDAANVLSWTVMLLVVFLLMFAGAGLFLLGFLLGRRNDPARQRGFDVVSIRDEEQH